MTISSELNNLKEKDIFSLMLFSLYKLRDDPKYSTLSEMAYLVDKHSLFNLCEFYGGLTIKIPTISELETMLYGLFLYQLIDIEHKEQDIAISSIKEKVSDIDAVQEAYISLKKILENYNLTPRG